MWAAILFCAVALVGAQQPMPCDSPVQFEGRFFSTDNSKNFTQFAKISYDDLNKRVREVEELEFGSTREYYDTLYLHLLGREYRVNLATRKCNVTTLTRPWYPIGIPPDAHYDDEFILGPVNIPNEHLDVITFSGKGPDFDYFGQVSSPSCIPVSMGFFSKKMGFFHRTFFDITLGISDPEVFNIPSECQP